MSWWTGVNDSCLDLFQYVLRVLHWATPEFTLKWTLVFFSFELASGSGLFWWGQEWVCFYVFQQYRDGMFVLHRLVISYLSFIWIVCKQLHPLNTALFLCWKLGAHIHKRIKLLLCNVRPLGIEFEDLSSPALKAWTAVLKWVNERILLSVSCNELPCCMDWNRGTVAHAALAVTHGIGKTIPKTVWLWPLCGQCFAFVCLSVRYSRADSITLSST